MTVLGGLGAVLSQEISRDEIYMGMIARRCYGTTGNEYTDLTANKVRMGEVVVLDQQYKVYRPWHRTN